MSDSKTPEVVIDIKLGLETGFDSIRSTVTGKLDGG